MMFRTTTDSRSRSNKNEQMGRSSSSQFYFLCLCHFNITQRLFGCSQPCWFFLLLLVAIHKSGYPLMYHNLPQVLEGDTRCLFSISNKYYLLVDFLKISIQHCSHSQNKSFILNNHLEDTCIMVLYTK